MKKVLYITCISIYASMLLCSYIPVVDSFEYHSDIYRTNLYGESSVLVIDDRMFVDSKYALEEYSVDEYGNLEAISYDLYDYNHALIPMKKHGNIMYQTLIHLECLSNSRRNVLRALEVSEEGWEEINRLEIFSPYERISNIELNQDYLFYLMTGTSYTNVIERETFEPVTDNLLTGGRFAVKDTLLFMQMINYPDSTYVSIQDISDVANPVELSRVYSNDIELNRYFFHDNILFITKNTKILIVDIKEPSDPAILSVLDNFPGLPAPEWNFFCNAMIYEEYMIIMNNLSMLFIYDISNPGAPLFLNSFPGDTSSLNRIGALLENNGYIYFGRFNTGISKIDAALLPEIVIICDCLKTSRIMDRFICSPYYIINNWGNLHYFNVHNESEIFQLSDDLFHSRWGHAANDSLLFWAMIDLDSTGQESYLRIYDYDDEGIDFITEHSIEDVTHLTELYWKEPYLIARKHSPHYYGVYSIDEQYDLIEEGIITLPGSGSSWVLNDGEILPEEYVYIYCYTTENILIYDYQYPFDLLQQIPIQQYGNYDISLMYDQDLFVFYHEPDTFDGLHIDTGVYNHSFPDQFIEIDRLQVADRYFQFFTNLNIFHISVYRFRPREFYYFDHTGITHLGDYNFSHNDAMRIDFFPELSKFYVLDIHGSLLQRYNVDYTTVAVEEEIIETPHLTTLYQNYPNPFNPETRIEFFLEKGGEVKLEVFNIKGQKLATLVNKEFEAGEHSLVWNPKTATGKDLPSGVYLYRLQTGDYDRTRKMLYLK